MQVRLLLGPAGSGKTFQCLTEIHQVLSASPEGPPLLLLAPKQTTYQLERQLLAAPSLPGYTRLHILSFERLSHFIFDRLGKASPRMLDEEGRLMVLRGLVARKRSELKLFRASARLTGFAQQLSLALRELQRGQLTPESLNQLAGQVQQVEGLAFKLQDLATLLGDYLDWLRAHKLQDADYLLAAATAALGEGDRRQETGDRRQETGDGSQSQVSSLKSQVGEGLSTVQGPRSTIHGPQCTVEKQETGDRSQESGDGRQKTGDRRRGTRVGDESCDEAALQAPRGGKSPSVGTFHIAHLWVDGFAEFSKPELDLLAALLPNCQQATLTFCLDQVPGQKSSWLSPWSVVRATFEACRERLAALPDAVLCIKVLPRDPAQGRFPGNPILQHLERFWADPHPFTPAQAREQTKTVQRSRFNVQGSKLSPSPGEPQVAGGPALADSLRVAACVHPEAEATLAAREILRHVRAGGRYRDITVLVRKLEGYHEPLQRVFARYEIPFFLDRRESVSHHPLAELTRSALRTVAFQWRHDDWFAALKTGLVPAEEDEIDRLENEALARGWEGATWQQPISVNTDPNLTRWLADLHRRILPPFQRLALALAGHQNKPTGPQLAAALREFWRALRLEEKLQDWAAEISGAALRLPTSVHGTVWEQMNLWLANVELAFPTQPLPLREWLPILEAGLANLSVGVIPPALDQVLIGAIDRSRNPDIKLALVLGLNETVFPAPPEPAALLTEVDRLELEKRNVVLGTSARQHLARERYYAYLALTRARQRVVLTSALHDAHGAPLSPSPFLSQLHQLFPELKFESIPSALDWRDSQHVNELIGPLLKVQGKQTGDGSQSQVSSLKSQVGEGLSAVHGPQSPDSLKSQVSSLKSGNGVGGSPDRSGAAELERLETEDLRLETSDSIQHPASSIQSWETLAALPPLAAVLERLRHFQNPRLEEALTPELAARLYGPALRTSVSRMEQFAACPFKFFVHSGLRAEERQQFELDRKEQGTFQHDVLAFFHEELRQENKRWRDITPAEARERIARIANGLRASYRDGLLQASEQTRFMARVLTESLQDFVETLVEWMRQQYRFDPVRVELPFGEDPEAPAWTIDVGRGCRLEIYGRIDRVDLCREAGSDEALCAVVDYKSSQRQLDPVLMAHGLQLQLPTYLSVLRRWPNPREFFGVRRLVPAGVFYVNLRGKYDQEQNRLDALADPAQARKRAYRHAGRFDMRALPQLDARPEVMEGDQFNYRLTKDRHVHRGSHEALPTAQFTAMLDAVEANLKRMGQEVFAGVAKVAPYRKGTTTACDQCDYRAICRIDPWVHSYRVLRRAEKETE